MLVRVTRTDHSHARTVALDLLHRRGVLRTEERVIGFVLLDHDRGIAFAATQHHTIAVKRVDPVHPAET